MAPTGGRAPPKRRLPFSKSSLVQIGQFAVLSGLLLWMTLRGAAAMGYNWQWYRIPKYLYRFEEGEFIWGALIRGLWVTLEIAGWGLVLTIAIGLVVALLRMSTSFAGRLLAKVYLEAIRNTPLLVQLYLFYFVLSPIFGLDRLSTGILALAFFEGSFASEIIRAGIQSVPRGQWESADSLGLSPFDRLRDVILPQAVPIMLPPMTGQIISLIKHSSIVSVIAIFDLTTQGLNIIADTFMAFEIWFTVAAIYLAMTVSLSVFVSYLEHRWKVIR